jgi:hypothetical protein
MKNFFKYKTSILAVALIPLIIAGFSLFTDKNTPSGGAKVETFLDEVVINIDGRKTTQQLVSTEAYEDFKIHTSNTKISEFSFTSVGISWDELSSDRAVVILEAQLKEPKDWSEWIELEGEEDDFYQSNNEFKKKYALISADIATEMRYRFILRSDGKSSPVVKNIEYTFIRTGKTIDYNPISSPIYFSNLGPGIGFTEPTQIISRQNWGANESFRYLANNDTPAQIIEMNPDYYERFKDELQYSRIVEFDENGNRYKWPLQYPEQVKKIIVHHSATTRNLTNPAQAIRDIYHYHAMTRGWGDIGYNYIVDLNGRVYEGRYGGEGVIGAHAGPGNHGSIGIMILGSYQNESATEASIVGMSKLIYEKSKIHNFATAGMSMFRGTSSPNILGHRDMMSTQCPGDMLYERLPVVRTLSSQGFQQKEKFVKDYDFQNQSNLFYVEMKPEEKREVVVKLENIGKVNWDNKTFIVFETDRTIEEVLSFPTREGVVLAKMEENLVRPGEVATFKFEMEAGRSGRTVQMRIVPVINGTRRLTEYTTLPITIQQPFYKYEYTSGSLPPSTMESGTSFSARVSLKNTGNVSWEKSGDRAMVLKNPSGEITAHLSQDIVRPGETGTFNFNFRAPARGGTYTYNLTGGIKNANFSSPPSISFSTTVFAREYDGEVISRSAVNSFARGESYNLSMQIRNVGRGDWNRNNLKMEVMRDKDIQISNLTMQPTTVRTGEVADISFRVNVAGNADLVDSLLKVRATMSNRSINLVPAVFTYSVTERQSTSNGNEEPTIRIKLSFEGNPQISASTQSDVYSGTKHIRTMSASEIATVTREGGKYKVAIGQVTLTENDPIRFIPQNSGIIKIENYENRPAWNQTLNDNEYRGGLEVREDSGKLITINELLLEDYLKGLGEVPNAEETEKIKSVMIGARTYARYYMTVDQKFPGKPYHLDDDPNVTQKYIGYGFEKRAPNVSAGVNATKGMVITYNGKLVKTPYFNQSDGTRTKSAQEVWGWTTTPFLQSVDDSYCDGDRFLGHGVGMSGCGAHGMAKEGFTYEQILKHYYTGVQITKLY